MPTSVCDTNVKYALDIVVFELAAQTGLHRLPLGIFRKSSDHDHFSLRSRYPCRRLGLGCVLVLLLCMGGGQVLLHVPLELQESVVEVRLLVL